MKIYKKTSLVLNLLLLLAVTNELNVFSDETSSKIEINNESKPVKTQNIVTDNLDAVESNSTITSIPNGTTMMKFNNSTGELIIEPENGISGMMDSSISSIMLYTYDQIKSITINSGVSAPVDSYYLFAELPNLVSIDVTNLNVSNVHNMARMFSFDSALTTIRGLGVWDTSSVTEMWSMFDSVSSIEALDIGNWNTSSVIDMRAMFQSTSSLKQLNIQNWETSSVRDMSVMFYGAYSLRYLDLNTWDTSNVSMMKYMFTGMVSLESLIIDNWDTTNVTNMGYMFSENTSLTQLNLSKWNTKKVIDMNGMFNNDRLTVLTLGPNFQVTTGAETGLFSLTETEIYSGKWENIGQGSLENPKGLIILDSVSLMDAYGSGKTPPSKEVETYVWQKKAQPVITTINYSDGGKELIPMNPIPEIIGRFGDTYVIVNAPSIEGYHVKEITYNGNPVSAEDKVKLVENGKLIYIYENNETLTPIPSSEKVDDPEKYKKEDGNIQEQIVKSETLVDKNIQNEQDLPQTGEGKQGLWSTLFGLLIIVLISAFGIKNFRKNNIR